MRTHVKITYFLYAILIIALIVLSVTFHNYSKKDVNYLRCKFRFALLNSDSEDNSIKKIRYSVNVHNYYNKKVEFHVVINRPEADWYPYLDSFPEKYYSEPLSLDAKKGEYFDFETIYKSKDKRVTGGTIDEFDVNFISHEEYLKLNNDN